MSDIEKRLKTPCATTGAHYTIATSDDGFTVAVEMPAGVDLGSLTADDVDHFHHMIHDYAEEIAFHMIRQSQTRRGEIVDLPDFIPDARASTADHNAMEIIRRAAARMVKADPTLLEDA